MIDRWYQITEAVTAARQLWEATSGVASRPVPVGFAPPTERDAPDVVEREFAEVTL